MRLRPTVTIKRRGNANKWLSGIRRALVGPRRVRVGFPVGKVSGGIVMRAVWNEFGTRGGAFGGGWGGPIPERPFFRNAMAASAGFYRQMMRADAAKIIAGSMTMTMSLNRLGQKAVGDFQDSIGSNLAPANSPVTVSLKGSSRTLIDTGEMRQSVTYEVE